jgi:hypothetical protein
MSSTFNHPWQNGQPGHDAWYVQPQSWHHHEKCFTIHARLGHVLRLIYIVLPSIVVIVILRPVCGQQRVKVEHRVMRGPWLARRRDAAVVTGAAVVPRAGPAERRVTAETFRVHAKAADDAEEFVVNSILDNARSATLPALMEVIPARATAQ